MNNLSKCTILVVDDTETNIDILLEALSSDYEIVVAMDGKSALDAVEADLPDLILLDIMMPEMDGYEVCKQLKESETTKKIPVIFLTAKSEVEDEEKDLKLLGNIIQNCSKNRRLWLSPIMKSGTERDTRMELKVKIFRFQAELSR